MPKYKIGVESFSTRFIQRSMTVSADSMEHACFKAIDLFCAKEFHAGAIDPGEPVVSSVCEIGGGESEKTQKEGKA